MWPAGFYLTLKAPLCFGNNVFDFKKTSVAPIDRHTRTGSESLECHEDMQSLLQVTTGAH